MVLIIDGSKHAQDLCNKVANCVSYLKQKHNLTPGLTVLMVGESPASKIYVDRKVKKCKEVGISSSEILLPSDTSSDLVEKKITSLNNNPSIHGILVQLPLPPSIEEKDVINTINPLKDVDGFHCQNVGRLVIGQPQFVPCTPLGCMYLINKVAPDISGRNAIVIGRSNIVGKPMSMLLLGANATVTIAHSRTVNLEKETRQADIVVAAVGIPNLVKKDWIKPGALVIDVGINRLKTDDKDVIVGDCDFMNIKEVAGAITPVPGGVGPMTIACLLANTVKAACLQRDIDLSTLPEILP